MIVHVKNYCMVNCLSGCLIQLFADDMLIHISDDSVKSIIFNEDVDILKKWLESNSMLLIETKPNIL